MRDNRRILLRNRFSHKFTIFCYIFLPVLLTGRSLCSNESTSGQPERGSLRKDVCLQLLDNASRRMLAVLFSQTKAADTRQTNVGQQMLDNSVAEMADSADDDDVAAAVISVLFFVTIVVS